MQKYIWTGLIIAAGIIAARVVGKFFGIGSSTAPTATTTVTSS